jgi:hypothetical protein
LPHYSYVSLFGVNSLDELKLAMFENVESTALSEDKSALQTIDALMSERAGWRAKIKYLEKIPGLSKILSTDLVASVAFLGPVDGFDQDESASESDESTVTDCSFLAAHGDPLEAFQLADRLFDPGAGLVE